MTKGRTPTTQAPMPCLRCGSTNCGSHGKTQWYCRDCGKHWSKIGKCRKIGVVTLVCTNCGKTYKSLYWRINKTAKNHFCSMNCEGEYYSKNMRGTKTAQYKHGDFLRTPEGEFVYPERAKLRLRRLDRQSKGIYERYGNVPDDVLLLSGHRAKENKRY